MDRRLRIAVLHGGPSREHEISLLSGDAVMRALGELGHAVLPVRIERDGAWRLGSETASLEGAATEHDSDSGDLATPSTTALARLGGGGGAEAVDVVFVALHGAYGEDGTVQGLLEALRIPYTGSGVAASALAMDKERAKEVLVHHGLATPPWRAADRAGFEDGAEGWLDEAIAALGLPQVVKPPRDGSSFGLALARTREDLAAAVRDCIAEPDGRALAERRVAGTEVTCPVIGNPGQPLRTLPVVEIVPDAGHEVFDFDAKYRGASQEICPARISPEDAERVAAAALTAHRVLGCAGLSRSDFILGDDGTLWYLETNTVPGMTPESLSPLSARAGGLEFGALCEHIAELGLQRSNGG